MRYGYCRLLGCDVMSDLRSQVEVYVALGVSTDNIFFEYHSKEFNSDVSIYKLFDVATKGDIIVAKKMSRIARTLPQFLTFLKLCLDNKVIVEIDDYKLDFANLSKDTRTLISMLLDIKANLLSQTTRRGMEDLARRKKRIGAKPLVYSRIPERVRKQYDFFKTGAISIKEYSIRCNVSYGAMKRYVKIMRNHEKRKEK